MAADAKAAVFTTRGICKRYAAPVLQDVEMDLRAGEVHVLIGANGAGKSTLAKIISGLVQPTTGAMCLDGQVYAPPNKSAAERQGVHIVQQELNLIAPLSVAENLFLNALPSRLGFLQYRDLWASAQRALSRVDLDHIDPRTPVEQLGVGQQQLVEIAAALSRRCRVLILDEPTAALTSPQVDCLFGHIQRLKAEGVGIIYISHRMEEIRRIADRGTVLRDGRIVATLEADQLDVNRVVRLMVGKDVVTKRKPQSRPTGNAALRVENLNAGPLVRDVNFEVGQGEILGIGGLVGSGRTELLRAIFGADAAESGKITLSGSSRPRLFRNPHHAVRAGLAMIPEDRKHHGLLLPKSARMNTTLAAMSQVSNRGGWIQRNQERIKAQRHLDQTDVRCHTIEQPVGELSGGNQQKILFSRWLMRDARVFLLDEPTRGIDVAAKAIIYRLLDRFADDGKAVVIVSSDVEELMATCDRIAVMCAGQLVAIFRRDDWSQDRIMAAAIGSVEHHPSHPAPEDDWNERLT